MINELRLEDLVRMCKYSVIVHINTFKLDGLTIEEAIDNLKDCTDMDPVQSSAWIDYLIDSESILKYRNIYEIQFQPISKEFCYTVASGTLEGAVIKAMEVIKGNFSRLQ